MPILKQIDRLAAIVPSGVMAAGGNTPGSFLDLVSFLVFPACRTKTSVIRRLATGESLALLPPRSGLLFLLNLQNILLVDTLESTGMGPLSQRADKHKVTCHDSCNRSNHVFYL